MRNEASAAGFDADGNGGWIDRYLPAAPVDSASHHSVIDAEAIRGFLYRQRIFLASAIGLALLLGIAATVLMKPVYSASSTVIVDPYGRNIVEGGDVDHAIPVNEIFRFLKTTGDVVASRKLALHVFDSLDRAQQAQIADSKADDGKPAAMPPARRRAERRDNGAAALQGNVKVEVPIDSRMLTITYRAGSAELAAAVANAYADNLVLEDLRDSTESNAYAQKYLKEQIAKLRSRLEQAEVARNSYARANGIVIEAPTAGDGGVYGARPEEANPSIAVSTLSNVNETYAAARARRIEAQGRWEAVAHIPAAQLPQVQQNAAIQALVSSRSSLAGQLADLDQRYGESHPRIKEIKAQIAALDRQIATASADVKNGIRLDYEVARKQETALSAELGRVSDATMNEQDRRVRYNLMTRDAAALRTQLAALLDRYNQISSAAKLQSNSVSVLDRADVPSAPVSPRLWKNLLIALVLGAGLGGGLALLRDIFDDRLRPAEDVERKLGVPLVGVTPDVPERDLADETSKPYGNLMEAYASIRTTLESILPQDRNVVQITSSQPSEGKTVSAVALARKAAMAGRRTLLIDADLRKPAIARSLGRERPENGLVEVLLGRADLAASLLREETPNLSVLPVGSIPPDPVTLLSSDMLRDLIERVRHEYDLVVLDTSPVIGIADAAIVSRIADSTIFIVEANRIHFGQAKASLRRLRSAGANIAGVVLTRFHALEAGQNYGYHYAYYSYGEDGRS
ncbi:polysaccharide biosynthesis tyrosine autokinase [Novosphingobium sp. ZN18A2]|uniref:GumC family protein n=1 Tax=Novosphingobium sp. ZN18A2 TaxID=3079861 RepID=UPI0030D09AC7